MRRHRDGKKTAGRKAVIRMGINKDKIPPPPPWWGKRRGQITVCAKQSQISTREHQNRYCEYQMEYRQVAEEFKNDFNIDAVPVGGLKARNYRCEW